MTTPIYKPIFEDTAYENITDEGKPVPVAIWERVASNGQYNLRERQRKASQFWTVGTSIIASGTDNSEPDDYRGYYNNSGLIYDVNDIATAGYDPQTIGLQFSTHIAEPYLLTIPYSTNFLLDQNSPVEKLKIRIAAKIEQSAVQVIAYFRRTGKVDTQSGAGFRGIINPFDLIRFAGANDRDYFKGDGYGLSNAAVEALGGKLLTMLPTNITGTDGCSYFEIELPPITDFVDLETQIGTKDIYSYPFEGEIVLMFLSLLGGILDTDSLYSPTPFPDKQLQLGTEGSGAYITLATKYNAKYGVDRPPGKLHAMARVIYESGAPVDETWHHVLQLIPLDPTKTSYFTDLFDSSAVPNPWDTANYNTLVLYPSIPLSRLPTTALIAGSTIELYFIGTVTLFSVTVEPSLRDIL